MPSGQLRHRLALLGLQRTPLGSQVLSVPNARNRARRGCIVHGQIVASLPLLPQAQSSQYRARDRVTSWALWAHGCMPSMASPVLPPARHPVSATRCFIYLHSTDVSYTEGDLNKTCGCTLHVGSCRCLLMIKIAVICRRAWPPAGYVPTAIVVRFC